MPITPGVWMPPPHIPAKVEKVIPAGVMPVSSRLTIIKPLASGMIIMMHSKQPQAVMGFSMMEYMATCSTVPWEATLAYSLTPVK